MNKIKNICVVGAGGVGGFFAGKLMKTGKYDVTIIARGKHLKAIKKKGLTLNTTEENGINRKPSLATDSFKDIPIPDLSIITVKGYDLDDAAGKLTKRLSGRKSIILPLLNGVDIYERLKKYADNQIVLPGCVYIGSHIEKPGVVTQTGGAGLIIFGRDPDFPEFNPKNILTAFKDAGIKNRWEDDPFPAIWEKYIFIASFALVSAFSSKTLGEIRKDSSLNSLVEKIAEEITGIARARKIELPPDIVEQTLKKADLFPGDTKTSYQRDMEIPGKQNEGELFGGTILRLGKELGIRTPVTASLYNGLKGKK